jgi:hypothetical protein
MEPATFVNNLINGMNFSSPNVTKESIKNGLTAFVLKLGTRDKKITDLSTILSKKNKMVKLYSGTPYTGQKGTINIEKYLQRVELQTLMNNYDFTQK